MARQTGGQTKDCENKSGWAHESRHYPACLRSLCTESGFKAHRLPEEVGNYLYRSSFLPMKALTYWASSQPHRPCSSHSSAGVFGRRNSPNHCLVSCLARKSRASMPCEQLSLSLQLSRKHVNSSLLCLVSNFNAIVITRVRSIRSRSKSEQVRTTR